MGGWRSHSVSSIRRVTVLHSISSQMMQREPESIRAVLQVLIPVGQDALFAVHDRWPTPDVLNAVLMCRHPRLGVSSPPAMRDLPDGVWCCVFFFVHSMSEPAMLVGSVPSRGFTY